MPLVYNEDGPTILEEEVQCTINKMKDGKAGGEDKITVEMLKALDTFGIKELTKILNEI